ncbi:hypothetical protein SAMN05216188_104389 [Lentzea xinjiangensis]|uniref:Uncharacterized protein n=1 Tax=Lentzea xinjiangensis TaxID=402600 RepID=A0A1H9I7W6_9PSEU|nr:hypothetical protein [Lentzea xinjiangensis]SEQ70791.1 hypothetical protein SAMN05216188_104389 [Lentzea xinjiangensis]
MRKLLVAVTSVLAFAVSTGTAAGAPLPHPEIFATNNTAIITDPDDPRLRDRLVRFDHEVRGIVLAHGGHTARSTLLDGVFWSSELQQTTFERSRKFDVTLDEGSLRRAASAISERFRQEAVLTFRSLPATSPEVDAVRVEVGGLTARQVREGLLNDAVAREKLGGGSVTLHDTAILIAGVDDLPAVRAFVTNIGGDMSKAKIRKGTWEFVGADSSAETPLWIKRNAA